MYFRPREDAPNAYRETLQVIDATDENRGVDDVKPEKVFVALLI